MKMRFVFLNLVCNILLPISYAETTSNLHSGPYKSTLTKTEPCKNPPKPYEKNPAMIFYSETYTSGKKNLFRGNLTVIKVNPNLKVSTKGFIQEDGKWKVVYIANSVGCNGALLRLFKIALKIQNLEGCVPKGNYTFEDVDFNAIQHMWIKTYQYGKFQWKVAIGTRTLTTICWDFETLTEPE